MAKLDAFQNQIQKVSDAHGGDIPQADLRQIRQVHDEIVSQSKGGFALPPDAQSAVNASKTFGNAIRSSFGDSVPDLADANKQFSFWSDVDKVTGDSLMRKTGQRAPLTQKLMAGAGAAVGSHFGPAGAVIGMEAGAKLGALQNSTIWNTLAAATKSKISDLISSGDEAGAIALAKSNGVVPTEASAASSAAESVPPSVLPDAQENGPGRAVQSGAAGASGSSSAQGSGGGSVRPASTNVPVAGGSGADTAQAPTGAVSAPSSEVQTGLDLARRAKAAGIPNIDDFVNQEGLLAKDKYSANALKIAKGASALKSGADSDAGRMMRPFPDVPFDKEAATQRDVLRGSRVFYRSGKSAGQMGTVYVNAQSRELLTHVADASTSDAFDGYSMPGPLVKQVIRNLDKTIVKNELGVGAVKPLYALRQALQKSLKDNGKAILVDAGPGGTLSDVKATIRHELHHAYETDFTPEQAQTFMEDPIAHKAGRNLVGDDPENPHYEDEPVNLTSEIAAHLQEGPRGERALDLTPDQADYLWRRYVRQYPGQLRFDRMRSTLKQAANEELLSKTSRASSESKSADVGEHGAPEESPD